MADFRSQRSVWSTLTQYQFLLPCVCSKQVSFSLPQSLEISKYRIFSVQSVWISKALQVNFLFHIIFFFLWFKTFLLFPSSESSNQCHSVCFPYFSYLYQIAHLGDDDDEPEFSSAMELEEGTTFFFSPRGLKNLVLVDELESLAPVMSCQV